MDEQSRIWREIGLHYVFQPPRFLSDEPVDAVLPIAPEKSETPICSRFQTHLPKALRFYCNRIHPPIIVLLTYASLDLDFRGSANPERVRLVYSIIKASPWSPSDVAFWPLTLHNESLSPNDSKAILGELINELSPKYLLDFGGIASDMIFQSFCNHDRYRNSENSFRHIMLPALDAMLPNNKPVKKQAWDIIRSLSS